MKINAEWMSNSKGVTNSNDVFGSFCEIDTNGGIKLRKKLRKGTLHQTGTTREILFTDDGKKEGLKDKDIILKASVRISLQDGQMGYYSEEFKPPFVDDEGGKKLDIMVMITDEQKRNVCSWLYDVKATVGGENVIFHLVEQLKTAYTYKNMLVSVIDFSTEEDRWTAFTEIDHLGYITREYQEDRIREAISKRQGLIARERKKQELMSPFMRSNQGRSSEELKAKKELRVLEPFLEDKLIFQGEEIHLERCIMTQQPDGTYLSNLEVSC